VVLPQSHLARLVERVVQESVARPPFDPRPFLMVLAYGYATGVRGSRQLERSCNEHLAYLYLTRSDTPSYRTLCNARIALKQQLQEVFKGLFAVAEELGMKRAGHLVVDATWLRQREFGSRTLSGRVRGRADRAGHDPGRGGARRSEGRRVAGSPGRDRPALEPVR
jgi:hypothetical protein